MILTIYSRPGCHLCDEMKAVVRRAVRGSDRSVEVEEVDISGNADLEARYGIEIPVLMVDGRKAAKYRVTEWDVRRILTARSTEAGRRGGAEVAGKD